MGKRWQIVPTSRRTSKDDRVDILDGEGRYVAGDVKRSDALRMIHDPLEIAEDAINLYVEGMDRHDGDHGAACGYALPEIIDAVNTDLDAIHSEMAEERQPGRAPEPDPSLPF